MFVFEQYFHYLKRQSVHSEYFNYWHCGCALKRYRYFKSSIGKYRNRMPVVDCIIDQPFKTSCMLRYITYSILMLTSLHTSHSLSAQTTPSTEKRKAGKDDVKVINGNYEHRSNGTTTIINTDDNGSKYRLIVEGSLSIANDEKSITAISSGGRFEYSRQQVGEAEHKVIIRSAGNGQLDGQYWINNVAKDYTTAGKAWLAQYLPEMISKTGIGAEARAERLFKEGGVNKVLAYTASMASGMGRDKIYSYLLTKDALTEKDIQILLEQLATSKSSDYELARILTGIPASKLTQTGVSTAYVAAATAINSDYEKARALKHLLAQEQLSEVVLNDIAKSIISIKSDYEKVRILSNLASHSALSDQQFIFALQAIKNVNSDYERGRGLSSLLTHQQQVIKHFDTVMPVIKSMGSDYEKSKVYAKLLQIDGLTADHYIVLLNDSEKLGSDYEKSNLLQKIAKQMPRENKKIREAYLKSVKTIGSSYEYSRAVMVYQQ
jgi:hypothetical protein